MDGLGPAYFYDLARLKALTGSAKEACSALTGSFELTPPGQLETLQAKVRECRDFGQLVANPAFTHALNTPSRIKESGCSKGPACGRCPKRAQCGHERAKDDKKGP